ncbi:signal peptidase II [Clostridium sp. MD294]|uniref:signal peptidase II n=1 Tax=Clostridium sp. MD294 TaxID=97138 RepID=UPI0002CC254F|nr:signal peptidase II [Clostridium sp. MD294]NDO46757.1 signal peptidase II [Clostridium sp. MD294]USF28801.1 Lipoprotein signal peptidase [Clostridium sp. MD294]
MDYFIIVALITIVDNLTKKMVCKNIKVGEKKEIVKKRLYFWHIKNKGAAYNSFEGHIKAIKCVSVISMIYCAFQIGKSNKINSIACSLLLGGGLGNFIERVKYGEVTDFIYINNQKKYKNVFMNKIIQKSTPIFNVADVFVALGATIFILSAILQKEK